MLFVQFSPHGFSPIIMFLRRLFPMFQIDLLNVYGVKDKKLAQIFIKALSINEKSKDGQSMKNFTLPRTNDKVFALMIFRGFLYL